MGNLQLADNNEAYYSSLAEPTNVQELYLYVPNNDGGGQYVREDYFDNLTDLEYEQVMDELEPYQNVGVSGIFSRMREKSRARRESRRARKDLKTSSKATARIQRTAGGGGLKNILSTVTGIFGGQQPVIDAGMEFQTGKDPQANFSIQTDKPFYTKPAFIIGSLVVVGGIAYLATRKK